MAAFIPLFVSWVPGLERLLGVRRAVARGDLLITVADAGEGGQFTTQILWLKKTNTPETNSAEEALKMALWGYLDWARSQNSSISQPLAEYVTRALESPDSWVSHPEEVEAPPAKPQSVQPSRSRWVSKAISSAKDWVLWVLAKVETYGYMMSHLLIIATLI